MHTSNVARQAIERVFRALIGRGGILDWPARSPDLNPLDYFLWGFIKSFIYDQNPPQSLEELEEQFQQALQNLTAEMIRKATHEEFIARLEACIRADGRHFEQLLKAAANWISSLIFTVLILKRKVKLPHWAWSKTMIFENSCSWALQGITWDDVEIKNM